MNQEILFQSTFRQLTCYVTYFWGYSQHLIDESIPQIVVYLTGTHMSKYLEVPQQVLRRNLSRRFKLELPIAIRIAHFLRFTDKTPWIQVGECPNEGWKYKIGYFRNFWSNFIKIKLFRKFQIILKIFGFSGFFIFLMIYLLAPEISFFFRIFMFYRSRSC